METLTGDIDGLDAIILDFASLFFFETNAPADAFTAGFSHRVTFLHGKTRMTYLH